MRICVIGCGAIANSMHGPSYKKYKMENPKVIFAGCCDIDNNKARDFKTKFGFNEAYTSIDRMLIEQKPDAVCLITPVDLTAGIAEKILNLGIPLLMEKPPGRIKEETQRLIDAADAKNVPHMVAFNRRFAPLIRKLKEILDNDFPYQSIQCIQYDMFRINRLDDDFSTTAIHAVDAAKFIAASDYKKVNFTYRNFPKLGKNITDVYMECEMENKIVIKINICPVTGINMEKATVNLFDHTIFLDYLGALNVPDKTGYIDTLLNPEGRLTLVQKNKIIKNITCSELTDGNEPYETEGFYLENKLFFDSILSGKKPSCDLRSTLQSVEIADYIRNRMSGYTSLENVV